MEKVSFIKGKKILVTGGAGFIGSNLCEYLLENGAYVYCLDNFITGFRSNISKFLEKKNFTLIEGDICDLKLCQQACNGVDFVLHNAALGSVPRSLKNPLDSHNVNINGFLNMLYAAKENKVKRFIYASSSSVYGNSKTLPKTESDDINPLSPYALTKCTNELYANNFNLNYGIDTIGLRYFNVFGRRQSPLGEYAAVIPIFINSIIKGQKLIVNGDGLNSRDFTYIDNVIRMNLLAITTNEEKAINQIYNVGVGIQTNLLDLIKILYKHIKYHASDINKLNIYHGPKRAGDVAHSLASIKKANELLNYTPSHSIEEGIKESVEWYISNL